MNAFVALVDGDAIIAPSHGERKGTWHRRGMNAFVALAHGDIAYQRCYDDVFVCDTAVGERLRDQQMPQRKRGDER